MPRNEKTKKKNALRRAASAVMRLFSRGQMLDDSAPEQQQQPPQVRTRPRQVIAARPAKREADFPLDAIDRVYTPPLTSSKASFRSDGTDHQRDQDLPLDTEWNDEDRYTNKSGDPRIGTHRRTYEPEEARAEK